MKKVFFGGMALLLVPFATFAQTAPAETTTTTFATTIADPGLIPGDFFYFIDKIGETINTALTLNKEKKARLHLEYAKERVAEVKEVLKNPKAKLEDIASAKEDFATRVAEAALLVKTQKESGADVADLARELDDDLDVSRIELKKILREHQSNQGRAESVIREKLGSLTDTEAPQLEGLVNALNAITKEKSDAIKEEGDIDTDLEDEQALFEEVMGKEMSAQKHIEQAVRLRDRLEEKEGQIPTQALQMMKQAQEAINRGDFDSAKRISKDAEKALEDAKIDEDNIEMEPSIMMGLGANEDIDVEGLDDLERGIKESERMMQSIGVDIDENEANTSNR